MFLIRRLLGRILSNEDRPVEGTGRRSPDAHLDAVARAHGAWIALLATILEREGVVSSDELACLLTEFAAVTALDKPTEARILSAWAATLKGVADPSVDRPSLH